MWRVTQRLPVGLAEQATLFRNAGARRVAGVDSSSEMVAYAQRVEERDPLGISYELYDAVRLPRMGSFDVVTAVWLLGYAAGETALDEMLAGLAANLTAAHSSCSSPTRMSTGKSWRAMRPTA
ncbi:class I SAM-dependent methyltransferase [Amycolatopsis sp.]|jgi:hypothetical protein|uniref:class I SAM-dependent methyltransferase n=1 Tax=Amycolatopsis sp. TaxID=37632 RepID=UPI002DFF562A|nr:class I SAM-dependent methyltransferase [Amycolatopsis sp.]